MKKELKSGILSADKFWHFIGRSSADKSADGRSTVCGVNVIAVLGVQDLNFLLSIQYALYQDHRYQTFHTYFQRPDFYDCKLNTICHECYPPL